MTPAKRAFEKYIDNAIKNCDDCNYEIVWNAAINFAIEHAGKITSAKMARYGNTDPGVIGAEDVTNALEDLTKETEE